eukprot:TRINITY_DN77843_c0_g1_i1.p1 TRINITY_DN77843_c0_g1~~TRINITY_DN77843_c0_g1_i1.p1  ORF type:complete len:593 (-),score=108.18 TRINITY_DN77843_c0_g1_i1:236-2014(-)
MSEICKLCGDALVTSGLGRLPLPCGHRVHEQCALQSRVRNSAAQCPNCDQECEDLMGADALCQKAEGHVICREFEEAARLLTVALDLQPHHPDASSALGQLFAEGRGVEANLEKAVELLRVGLASGSSLAALKLGGMYSSGVGVKKDTKKALKLLEQALAAGLIPAATFLAHMYLAGDGVPKDEERATAYLEQAVLAGIPIDPDAATLLGIYRLKRTNDVGFGLQLLEIGHQGENAAASFAFWDHYKRTHPRKAFAYLEAAHWAGHAAGQPILDAAWTLGLQYLNGIDEAKGIYFLLVARDAGHPDAVKFVPQLISGFSIEGFKQTTMMAKAAFAPADGQSFTASQLKDRADKMWSAIKSGTMTLSDLPSEVLSHANAQRSEEIPRGVSSSFAVHVIQYSRHPKMLRRALLEGEELKECRDELAARGYSCEQSSGAKVFVLPEQFEPVIAAIEDQDLKPWHVVVSDEFEKAVVRTVKQLPSQEQVREKSNKAVVAGPCNTCGMQRPRFVCHRCSLVRYCSRACQQQDWRVHKRSCIPSYGDTEGNLDSLVVVKRTFLEVPLKNSLRSSQASVDRTKSTTDTDPRKGMNPRKA